PDRDLDALEAGLARERDRLGQPQSADPDRAGAEVAEHGEVLLLAMSSLQPKLALADVRAAADQVAPDPAGAIGPLLVQPAVAVVARAVDPAVLDRGPDRAA